MSMPPPSNMAEGQASCTQGDEFARMDEFTRMEGWAAGLACPCGHAVFLNQVEVARIPEGSSGQVLLPQL